MQLAQSRASVWLESFTEGMTAFGYPLPRQLLVAECPLLRCVRWAAGHARGRRSPEQSIFPLVHLPLVAAVLGNSRTSLPARLAAP